VCSTVGRGRYLGNVLIERLRRSIDYDAVYLENMAGGLAAERMIRAWLHRFSHERRHSALEVSRPEDEGGAGRET